MPKDIKQPNSIVVKITPVDVKNATSYQDNANCSLANAIKRTTGSREVHEFVNGSKIDHKEYSHKEYEDYHFTIDLIKTAFVTLFGLLRPSNKIVLRTVVLTPF